MMKLDPANQWLESQFKTFEQEFAQKEQQLAKETDLIKRILLHKEIMEDLLIIMLFQNDEAMSVFNDYFYGKRDLFNQVDRHIFLKDFKDDLTYDPDNERPFGDLDYYASDIMANTLDTYINYIEE